MCKDWWLLNVPLLLERYSYLILNLREKTFIRSSSSIHPCKLNVNTIKYCFRRCTWTMGWLVSVYHLWIHSIHKRSDCCLHQKQENTMRWTVKYQPSLSTCMTANGGYIWGSMELILRIWSFCQNGSITRLLDSAICHYQSQRVYKSVVFLQKSPSFFLEGHNSSWKITISVGDRFSHLLKIAVRIIRCGMRMSISYFLNRLYT